jgi:hypothetical protein
MKTKIVLENELWKRLQHFSLDSSQADFPFSKKLAKEENWTESFTSKAIEEYKKFVYLCCTLPNGASPSEVVDKVWHMHLIYTQNYWEEFCPNVLQQKLHHHPSKGGKNENLKHQAWFYETLKHYEDIFGEKAPEDIWINQNKKRKRNEFSLNSFKILSVFSIVFMVSSCSDRAADFFSLVILIPIILAFISFISGVFNKNNSKDKNNNDNGSGGGCGGSSSSCSSSCGSSCGGGCGGCGGGD